MANILTQHDGVSAHVGNRALALIFTATIFLSATLLFSVQPMFTKLILPLLGGASNVWNTAMVFFQAMLLGGYLYAHFSSRYLSLRAQIALHLMVTVVGLAFLPLAVGVVDVPETGMPTLWLLGLFAATVGMPFFALSANAPLMQRWFSLTNHPDAEDPYFLYSASNAASLLILCAYPVLIEPSLRLGEQTSVWAWGYGGLILLIGVTGLMAFRNPSSSMTNEIHNAVSASTRSITLKTILFWLTVSFIPSSLMLGVTTHMTSNIASVPLLWIVPLALYLLTFVIVFARRPLVSARQLGPVIPWLVLITLLVITLPIISAFLAIAICLISFFVIALYCHARLVESRPDAASLTIFYIIMSLGGVMGGAFNALAAPVLFSTTLEYPLILFCAAFILPAGVALTKTNRKGWFVAMLILCAAVATYIAMTALGWLPRMAMLVAALIVFAATLPINLRRTQSGLILCTLIGIALFQPGADEDIIYQDRSFYSTMAVKTEQTPLGVMHRFMHGDTVHNFQLRDPGLRTRPASYYAPNGSFDIAIRSARKSGQGLIASLIGLGAGALSCYEQAGDQWTYFEIDPAIVDMARDPSLFSYLSDCAPEADIRIGDARQTLAGIPDGSQELIIVDAFSSGSIPAHLVTREALDLYQSKLAADGLIFFHTSNRMMDVTSVVARIAQDAGLESRYILKTFQGDAESYSTEAHGMLVGPEAVIRNKTRANPDWQTWIPSDSVGVWTDDHSAVVSAIYAMLLQDGQAGPISPTDYVGD